DHVFEAWFSDSSSFEKQNKKNLISCLTCSSTKIKKDIWLLVFLQENKRPID
ncbi:MAG: DUF1178 family protein, partial [Alphaproteobacteria bacterium]|nr:DUF1178 family protein [Alphaproteobacteria bacterium]